MAIDLPIYLHELLNFDARCDDFEGVNEKRDAPVRREHYHDWPE